MHEKRHLPDGTLRDPDNWTKGMPRLVYLDSLLRHVESIRLHLEGHGASAAEPPLPALCAIIFNAMGLMLEILLERDVQG